MIKLLLKIGVLKPNKKPNVKTPFKMVPNRNGFELKPKRQVSDS